jgi:GT2 family glycosyltransferase
VAAIRSAFPTTTLLESSTNLGYAEGNNLGLRYALECDADDILLLNNDTIVDASSLESLVSTIESDPSIGAVGPKILYQADPRRLWSAGGRLNFTETVGRMRGYRQIDRGQFDRVEAVDYLSGCALLLRRTALERVGLLDPIYSPAYFEDADWCVRARRSGYQLVYVPTARIWHKVSMSGGGEYNLRERYLIGFNSIVFMKRYANRLQWLKYLIFAVGSLPVLYLVRLFQGQGRAVRAKALGIWDGWRGTRRETYLK